MLNDSLNVADAPIPAREVDWRYVLTFVREPAAADRAFFQHLAGWVGVSLSILVAAATALSYRSFSDMRTDAKIQTDLAIARTRVQMDREIEEMRLQVDKRIDAELDTAKIHETIVDAITDITRKEAPPAIAAEVLRMVNSSFVWDETPTGLRDGRNAVFSLKFAPNPPSSLQLRVGGLSLRQGDDYDLKHKTITFYEKRSILNRRTYFRLVTENKPLRVAAGNHSPDLSARPLPLCQ